MYYIQAINSMKKFDLLFLKNKFVPFLFHFPDCLCQQKNTGRDNRVVGLTAGRSDHGRAVGQT